MQMSCITVEKGNALALTTKGVMANNLLVIDDDRAIREAVGDILSLIDVPVLQAKDGQSGVETYIQHEHEVGVVMLDLGLPDADGMDILEELREINPDVKVIVASGKAIPDDGVNASDESTAYLPKPYNIDGLLGLVESFLEA